MAAISQRGVGTAGEFAALMIGLIDDVIEDRISVGKANAITSAGGKLLKAVELQHRYGSPVTRANAQRNLKLG